MQVGPAAFAGKDAALPLIGRLAGHVGLADVDRTRSRAYGIGFNGLYLNLAGREAQGSVAPEQAEALRRELAAALEAERDPKTGEPVVLRVYPAAEIVHGARVGEAPDLVVGYNQGYAGSDPSTLGEITEAVLEDNTSRWSGNHLIDPRLVPGVLLVNRPGVGEGHDLTDVTATLLAHYGLEPVRGMVGSSFLPGRLQTTADCGRIPCSVATPSR